MHDTSSQSSEQLSSRQKSRTVHNSTHLRRRHTSKLQSLARAVSPPPLSKPSSGKERLGSDHKPPAKSISAAVEAGEHRVEDHLEFYSQHLQHFLLQPWPDPRSPRINLGDWFILYQRHAGSTAGSHFVVHQHDHPIAGTHYDLRLQCNPTSSISFAIMYGLPGDPNSLRLNRNATETRVHCLWNHLIETGSYTTGSMLIWDCGRYEILPSTTERTAVTSSDRDVSAEEDISSTSTVHSPTEQQKLARAFRRGKVKLRLHGTRLPAGYTLSLRLSSEDKYRAEQPKKPSRRRRRGVPTPASPIGDEEDSERPSSQEHPFQPPPLKRGLSSLSRMASPPPSPRRKKVEIDDAADVAAAVAAAHASDDEDEHIRANNAYSGATNDIGSIHQRKWFLSIDRVACGFQKQTERLGTGSMKTTWIGGFDKFVVGGRETERSIVTGRVASQILHDEGVVNYVPRGLWRSIDY